MANIYFIKSTLLCSDYCEEQFWEEGFLCFVKECDLFRCYDELEKKTYAESKGRNLSMTVGLIHNINGFDQIVDANLTTSIIYNTQKCLDEQFTCKNIGKHIDPDINFGIFRMDNCITEIIYKNNNFYEI